MSLLSYLLYRSQRRVNRSSVDHFARIWLALSAHLLTDIALDRPFKLNLDSTGRPLESHAQDARLTLLFEYARKSVCGDLFAQLDATLDILATECRTNRWAWKTYYLPLELDAQILQSVLCAADQLSALNDAHSRALFEAFFNHQTDIRNGLLRRISRSYGPDFFAANQGFSLSPTARLDWEKQMLNTRSYF